MIRGGRAAGSGRPSAVGAVGRWQSAVGSRPAAVTLQQSGASRCCTATPRTAGCRRGPLAEASLHYQSSVSADQLQALTWNAPASVKITIAFPLAGKLVVFSVRL